MSLVDRARKAFGVSPPPGFEPSPQVRYAVKRARRLMRNIEQASIYNPRQAVRARSAVDGARALLDYEYRTFKEAHA